MLIEEILAIKRKCNLENEIARVYNLTGKEMACILGISKDQVCSSRDLAAAIELSPSRSSRIIGKLIDQGLVQGKANPEDRRFLDLSLTEKGKICCQGLVKEKEICEQRLFSSLSGDEIDVIRRGLTLLLKAL